MDRGAWETGLDTALIGGRERANIVIADYDPRWPMRFEGERHRVRHALGNAARRIEHIGSTAVPGLAAKPIIDVLVLVEDPHDAALVRAMDSAGYELRVSSRWYELLKRELATREWADMNEYAYAKGEMIETILARAGLTLE